MSKMMLVVSSISPWIRPLRCKRLYIPLFGAGGYNLLLQRIHISFPQKLISWQMGRLLLMTRFPPWLISLRSLAESCLASAGK